MWCWCNINSWWWWCWWWWWWCCCWHGEVVPKCLIHKGCSHKRGLPKSTHAPTAEFAWSQPARAFGLKTLQKKVRERKRYARTQCPFQEVRGNLGQPQDTLIWHLTYKGTVNHRVHIWWWWKLWQWDPLKSLTEKKPLTLDKQCLLNTYEEELKEEYWGSELCERTELT